MKFYKTSSILLTCLLSGSCLSKLVDRTTFVTDILGIDEGTFYKNETALKNALSFSKDSSDAFLKNNPVQKIAFINTLNPNTYKPTSTSYQAGYFEEMSLDDLRDATKEMKPGGGVFNVIESANFPGDYIDAFDIGALQAKSENVDAVFQVASNFNGLEFASNAGNQMHKVYEYIYDNTQGPGASISAAPGTLFRQYYVYYDKDKQPKEWMQTLKHQIEFLGNTDIPTKNGYVAFPQKNMDSVKFNPQINTGAIKIGFQGATQVTYGLKKNGSQHEKISNPKQIINQVFTAAVDFATWSGSGNDIHNKKQVAIAKSIVQAAYEGTLRATLFKGKKKVILTLIGGGVFDNDIRWISTVLTNLKDFIKESGLDITLSIFDASGFIKKNKTMWSEFQQSVEQLVKDTHGTYIRYSAKKTTGETIVQPKKVVINEAIKKPIEQLGSAFRNITTF